MSFPGPAHHAGRGTGAGLSQCSMLAEEDSGIDPTSFPDELDLYRRAQLEQYILYRHMPVCQASPRLCSLTFPAGPGSSLHGC